jgi:HAD superfamily hydrolase (TIGR01509 family)
VSNDKGLFLDLDGTLAGSLPVLKDVYLSFLRDRGSVGSEAEFQRLNGLPFSSVIETLRLTHNLRGHPTELNQCYSAMIRLAHASSPPAIGADFLLKSARANGWKIAVVTSAIRRVAIEWLDRNALLNQVDAVVGSDDVVCGKPSPDPYYLALSQTFCAADKSFAVEDSRSGAQAALAAGLATWVIAPPPSRTGWPARVNFIAGLGDLIEKL